MANISKLDWETLEERSEEPDKNQINVDRVERARVLGGWLVRAYSATMSSVEKGVGLLSKGGVGHGVGVGVGITFVPDPTHSWKV